MIGVILATVTKGMVFDITGGILTTVGLLFAGVSTRVHRKKIINGYYSEIEKGRIQIEEEVSNRLKSYISNLKVRIDENFHEFDGLLEKEKEEIEQLENQHSSISQRLSQLQDEIGILE